MNISPEYAREIIRLNETAQLFNGLGALGGKKRKKMTPEERAEYDAAKAKLTASLKLMTKKQRRKAAIRAKKAAKRFRKQLKKGKLKGFIAKVNARPPVTLPLIPEEENLRQAVVAGDFAAMDRLAPFGPAKLVWSKNALLGKYRFVIQDGKQLYIPWSPTDIDNFIYGPWLQRSATTGLAPLIHPKRKNKSDRVGKIATFNALQEKVAAKYPNTDYRHVYAIKPGSYVFQSGEKSRWVKVRTPVMVAVAIVAAVYLGPIALQAAKAAMAAGGAGAGGAGAAAGGAAGGAAGTGGVIAGKATLAGKIFTGAKTLTKYVNQGRTVKAMIEGKSPPPPIGVSGNNFTEWALAEAKNQIQKEAMERGGEYIARKMTKKEEDKLRREIQEMQRLMAARIPPNAPLQPSPDVSPQVQEIMVKEKVKSESINNALMIGIPIAIGALVLGA